MQAVFTEPHSSSWHYGAFWLRDTHPIRYPAPHRRRGARRVLAPLMTARTMQSVLPLSVQAVAQGIEPRYLRNPWLLLHMLSARLGANRLKHGDGRLHYSVLHQLRNSFRTQPGLGTDVRNLHGVRTPPG